jgi:hypothetical protein
MKLNKKKVLAIAKFAMTGAASMGVDKVITNVIKNTTPALDTMSTKDKVLVVIGRIVIATVIADLASEHIVHAVDSYVTAFSVVEKEKKLQPEAKVA